MLFDADENISSRDGQKSRRKERRNIVDCEAV